MNKCSYCHEIKKCRFQNDDTYLLSGLIPLQIKNMFGRYVCEDCDKYLKHLQEERDKEWRE